MRGKYYRLLSYNGKNIFVYCNYQKKYQQNNKTCASGYRTLATGQINFELIILKLEL